MNSRSASPAAQQSSLSDDALPPAGSAQSHQAITLNQPSHRTGAPDPAHLRSSNDDAPPAPAVGDSAASSPAAHLCSEGAEFERKYPSDKFGEELAPDARIWKIYRDQTSKSDEVIYATWDKTLDMSLLFSALFSAVCTAFIVESYKLLQPDYNEVTAKLLMAIVNPRNGSLTLEPPPADFAGTTNFVASTSALWVNGLWFLSLAISLGVAFISILMKNWLTTFTRFQSAHIMNARDWARRRTLCTDSFSNSSISRWINGMPAALHVSLLLFMAGLVVFLWAFSRTIAGVLLGATAFLVVVQSEYARLPQLSDHDIHQDNSYSFTPTLTYKEYTIELYKYLQRGRDILDLFFATIMHVGYPTLSALSFLLDCILYTCALLIAPGRMVASIISPAIPKKLAMLHKATMGFIKSHSSDIAVVLAVIRMGQTFALTALRRLRRFLKIDDATASNDHEFWMNHSLDARSVVWLIENASSERFETVGVHALGAFSHTLPTLTLIGTDRRNRIASIVRRRLRRDMERLAQDQFDSDEAALDYARCSQTCVAMVRQVPVLDLYYALAILRTQPVRPVYGLPVLQLYTRAARAEWDMSYSEAIKLRDSLDHDLSSGDLDDVARASSGAQSVAWVCLVHWPRLRKDASGLVRLCHAAHLIYLRPDAIRCITTSVRGVLDIPALFGGPVLENELGPVICIEFWSHILLLPAVDDNARGLAIANLAKSVTVALEDARITAGNSECQFPTFVCFLQSATFPLDDFRNQPNAFEPLAQLAAVVVKTTDRVRALRLSSAVVCLGSAVLDWCDSVQAWSLRGALLSCWGAVWHEASTVHPRKPASSGNDEPWIHLLLSNSPLRENRSTWQCLLNILSNSGRAFQAVQYMALVAAAAARSCRQLDFTDPTRCTIISRFGPEELSALLLDIVRGWPAPDDQDVPVSDALTNTRLWLQQLLLHCIELNPDWVEQLRRDLQASDFASAPDVVRVIDELRAHYRPCTGCASPFIVLDASEPAPADPSDERRCGCHFVEADWRFVHSRRRKYGFLST